MDVKAELGKDLKEIVNNITGVDLITGKVSAYISATLFKERVKRGMSQKEFATLIGVSQRTVSKWESDNYTFSIETLALICDKLGLDLEIKMRKFEDKDGCNKRKSE